MEEIEIKEKVLGYLKEEYGEENLNEKMITINDIVEITENDKLSHLELILRKDTLTLVTCNEKILSYLKTKFEYYDSEKDAIWIDVENII